MRLTFVLSAAAVTLLASAAQAATPTPMETRSAVAVDGPVVSAAIRSFTGVELDEAEDFDGWTASLEFAMPLFQASQLRVYLPVWTEGDATATFPDFIAGDNLDIEGNTGVFEFATLEFQSQILSSAENHYELAWYAGAGYSLDYLQTTGGLGDRYNHKGWQVNGGVRAEGDSGLGRWFANAGYRYYPRSDDLNPGHDDTFGLVDLRLANRFGGWNGNLYPVVELTYLGDFSDTNQLVLIPELLYAPTDSLGLKAGVSVGTGNGNQFGGQLQVDLKF